MTTSFLDKKKLPIHRQLEILEPLVQQLKNCTLVQEKLEVLDQLKIVKKFLKNPSPIRTFLSGLSLECELVIKSVIAVGQGERVFYLPEEAQNVSERLRALLNQFLEVERFYEEMGGIVGYHWMTLQLLCTQQAEISSSLDYHPYQGIDISEENAEVKQAIEWGIRNLPKMAEIYPVGGAADRLRLQDEKTGAALPASKLRFAGKTLLEGLICDLQAREYLHYKLLGKQVITPVAMMTSQEKDNHAQVLALCEERGWFGRPKDSFRFFSQASVPVMNKDGEWCMQGFMQPLLKPGGHGVIWKLARDEGIFDWLFEQGKSKTLVRQINNPIAGVDYGLLAFTGLGCKLDKAFGFAACPRQTKAMEGTNVLIEKRTKESYSYLLTNIEYCDFKKRNIVDEPSLPGGSFSKFPSNTNILFADLQEICKAVARCPIPGMLVNVKKLAYRNEMGQQVEDEIARLESTMQNIADSFEESFSTPLPEEKRSQLKSFLTYNERGKTISTTKRAFVLGASLIETPEGCFLDSLRNARDLLVNKCQMSVPNLNDAASFFIKGPSFIFLYHPALGPLYSVIAQKLRKGNIAEKSEVQLEIADLDCENLEVEGSLLIQTEALLGSKDEEGIIQYSNQTGKCTLKNVKVRNLGIDRSVTNVFWRNEITRKECCHIVIHGNGEFFAEDVVLEGDLSILVENGIRLVAENKEGKVQFRKEPIKSPTWEWKYSFAQDGSILLQK